MNLFKGILYGLVAQVLTFIQLQGQMKSGLLKNNLWLSLLLGIPVSYLFMMSVKYLIHFSGGPIWPSRLIGFSIGIVVFTAMSYFWFREPITIKTAICLMLSLAIMSIQIFWK